MSNPRLPDEAAAAIARGDLLAAIKAVRKAGPVDLAAAKRAIEVHARELAAQQAGRRPHDADHSSGQQANARQASRANAPASILGKRPPTVAPGDAPGSMRWLLAVLFLMGAAVLLGVR